MLTLQRALDDQRDLSALCAERKNPTVDAFRGNGFYGMADVYKSYAGLPVTRPLNGTVPHGIMMDDDWFWEAEGNAPVPYVYCYPEYRQEIFRRRTVKEIVLSASPFVYVMDMLRDEPKPKRNGTLFFPVHSTSFITVVQDYSKLADKLLAFNERYRPVDVCMYWKDYLLGAAKPFLERGMTVVSAGHMYDRSFLYRLFHLLSRYQHTASSDLGGYVFYAVRSGCSYFNIEFPYDMTGPPASLEHDICEKTARWHDIERAFEVRTQAPTEEQREMVGYYLGVSHFKTRERMREELLR